MPKPTQLLTPVLATLNVAAIVFVSSLKVHLRHDNSNVLLRHKTQFIYILPQLRPSPWAQTRASHVTLQCIHTYVHVCVFLHNLKFYNILWS